ncbi:MAG TPA: cupin domain-containing protein [Steroidobacteraceae bacterium]|nr:cupin domain-containing protein [Steroidobacteraceae bacterium]
MTDPKPELKSCPIHPSWILEGRPRARIAVLSDGSSDESAFMAMWDCTAGRFNWFYAIDETVYILEGAVTVTLPSGTPQHLVTGSSFFFARGTQAQWQVDSYVRKVAFCHEPLSSKVFTVKRLFRAVRRVVRPGSAPERLTKMFETN